MPALVSTGLPTILKDFMQYIHVKNLEKYHPGYKDRTMIWCKVYFTMMNGDAEFEMIDEIDQMRFIKFIMLEIQTRKPVPADMDYLVRKGFNAKKRPLKNTLESLKNYIQVTETEDVTELVASCNGKQVKDVTTFDKVWAKYPRPFGKKHALRHYEATVLTPQDELNIFVALDNYLASEEVKKGFVKYGSTWFNEWQDWFNIRTHSSDGIPEEWKTPKSSLRQR